jgi:hypothetical protein
LRRLGSISDTVDGRIYLPQIKATRLVRELTDYSGIVEIPCYSGQEQA